MLIVYEIVNLIFKIYSFMLLANIVISWLPHDPYHLIVIKLKQLTDPYLDVFKQLPLQFGGIDFSPVVAFMALGLIQKLILQLLLI